LITGTVRFRGIEVKPANDGYAVAAEEVEGGSLAKGAVELARWVWARMAPP